MFFFLMFTGNMTMRWRGMTVRRMSMFPNADPTYAAFTEEAIKTEIENGKSPSLVSGYTKWKVGHSICILRGGSLKDNGLFLSFHFLSYRGTKHCRGACSSVNNGTNQEDSGITEEL